MIVIGWIIAAAISLDIPWGAPIQPSYSLSHNIYYEYKVRKIYKNNNHIHTIKNHTKTYSWNSFDKKYNTFTMAFVYIFNKKTLDFIPLLNNNP